MRIGQGFDVHQLVEGRRLIVGGVEIPYDKGLLGHSDADVLLHAISDALLGAAALGDIGKHFAEDRKNTRLTQMRSPLFPYTTLFRSYDKGLLGHSDADVLLHAISDALLGAAALGDIGKHFAVTEAKDKDIDSRILLR